MSNHNSEEYHGGFKNTDVHPASDFGDPTAFGDLDPEVTKTNTVQWSDCVFQGQYVVSTRIRCGRSVEGFPFNPNMTEQQYSELESLVSATLKVRGLSLGGSFTAIT